MIELKPCPFCTGKLIRDGLGQYWLHETATRCIFRGLLTTPGELEKWNIRPLEDLLAAQIMSMQEGAERNYSRLNCRIAELEEAMPKPGDMREFAGILKKHCYHFAASELSEMANRIEKAIKQ